MVSVFYTVSVFFHKNSIKVQGNQIEIGIMAKPKRGEANMEIIRKISKHFGVPSSNVRIVVGKRSRDKVIEVIR